MEVKFYRVKMMIIKAYLRKFVKFIEKFNEENSHILSRKNYNYSRRFVILSLEHLQFFFLRLVNQSL